MKRLWRQPAYLALLALIPVLGYAVSVLEQGERSGAVVAVCVEDSAWSEQIKAAFYETEEESVLRFLFCADEGEVERSVLKSEADCGFVIGTDIAERMMARDWAKSVTVYETTASSITGMAKERISGILFKLYSEQCYESYMRMCAEQSLEELRGTDTEVHVEAGDEALDETTDEASDETTAISTQEIVDFAKQAYETHLLDDSTFSFRYVNDDLKGQHTSDTDVISDTAVFPIKGVFAVVIFISGMCGMLEYDTDRREKRFLRMAPNGLTYIVDIWIPTVLNSLAVLICLWISEGIRSGGSVEGSGRLSGLLTVWDMRMWGIQAGHLLVYQCMVVGYCAVLGILLRNKEAVAAAIPILSLASLVCAPVFIRLASYIPLFAVLENLFPVTYYLRM